MMANLSCGTSTTLRNLPLPIRLTLAMFLVAAGIGYLTALVQLHFAHASPGNLLPTPDDAVKIFHGTTGPKMTQIERLLEAPDNMPFNGTGSMRKAFLEKSDEWKSQIKDKPAAELAVLKAEREGERLALLAWIRAGASKEAYEKNEFALPESLAQQPITGEFLKVDDKTSKPVVPHVLHIQGLISTRCAGCHSNGGEAQKFSLENYDAIVKYNKEPSSGAISLDRLASITHTHMMAFAVLFGCTGLLFAFTRFPSFIRAIFGPWVLFFQVVDIGLWWMARLDPLFAKMIPVSGALVGLGLGIQLLGGLYDIFGPRPRVPPAS